MAMFTFSIVRKIGEGKYLSEDRFILERIRRERALNIHQIRTDRKKSKIKFFIRNGRLKAS